MRFLNDRRETVRSANPSFSFAEITRILASEWSNLPADKKQHYLDAAVQDKERYTKEYNAYKQTQAYKSYTKQLTEKKLKENKEEKPNVRLINFNYLLNNVLAFRLFLLHRLSFQKNHTMKWI